MSGSGGRKVVVAVVAVLVVISTPVFWLLDGPDTGQLVGASVQAGTGAGALVWAWFQRTGEVRDSAVRTGRAEASGGGKAHTGIRRRGADASGAARVEQSGEAVARGRGSSANTGIDHTC
ncbi:hypothetical protein P8A22_38200 (plasmid) [Streptomyces laculatispora]|uniref:Secreted protein n=1 Tax=Streptomyces laculatispora TaxID=887464 RepID=A0ABY9IHX5_9ACTN|nr:hypothetical protein [Streptomyces laculatispora]WLQ45657.1 hypothetical protein P8A22_38200 [Streptomyces laculatispora]